jgi:hypothetical protein
MGLYLRKKVYWYKFMFQGQIIRESSNSRDRSVADRLQRERRRNLELGLAGLKVIKRPTLFSVVAKQWLEDNPQWSDNSYRIESKNLEHLLPYFGKLLLTDIDADDVSRYQAARKRQAAGPKTINLEVGTLRAILRRHRLWGNLQPDIHMLRVREDIGRALTADEEHRLLAACRKSRSRSLGVAVLLSLHTGPPRRRAASPAMAPDGSAAADGHRGQEQDGRGRGAGHPAQRDPGGVPAAMAQQLSGGTTGALCVPVRALRPQWRPGPRGGGRGAVRGRSAEANRELESGLDQRPQARRGHVSLARYAPFLRQQDGRVAGQRRDDHGPLRPPVAEDADALQPCAGGGQTQGDLHAGHRPRPGGWAQF